MSRFPSLLCVALFLLSCGCGGKPAPIPFSGEVKLNGAPLGNANVQFFAIDDKGKVNNIQFTATGQTDSAGRFSLVSPNEGSGVLPGTYKVTVVAIVAGKLTEEQAKFPGASSEMIAKPLVAPAFADPVKTPLQVTVPGGPNVLEVSAPNK